MKKTLITIASLLAAFQIAAAATSPREVVFENTLDTGASAEISFSPLACKNFTMFAAPHTIQKKVFMPPCCPKFVKVTTPDKKGLLAKTKIKKSRKCEEPTVITVSRSPKQRNVQIEVSADTAKKSSVKGDSHRRPVARN